MSAREGKRLLVNIIHPPVQQRGLEGTVETMGRALDIVADTRIRFERAERRFMTGLRWALGVTSLIVFLSVCGLGWMYADVQDAHARELRDTETIARMRAEVEHLKEQRRSLAYFAGLDSEAF